MILLSVLTVVLCAIDIVTKIIFRGESFSLIPGVIGIHSTENTGIAFGLFEGARVVFIILTFIILAVGVFLFWKVKKKTKFLIIAAALFAGGALGNLIDRIFLGYVRDFIMFEFFEFPIFNMADVFLNIGVVMIAIYLIFLYKEEDKKEKPSVVAGTGEVVETKENLIETENIADGRLTKDGAV
jgi:signal peptidase II